MNMNHIGIVQNENQYLLYLPTNICVGQIAFPDDHQYLQDAKALDIMTKALALRWGVIRLDKKHKF